MTNHIHSQTVPRGAIFGAAALIACTLGLAASARGAHPAEEDAVASSAPPAASVIVRFEDRSDGSLAVLEASTGRELSLVPPGTNGFIRGVLRGMFRQRKLESLPRDGRFELAREVDGRLTLEDLDTGRRVDLRSFGSTNEAAFEAFLLAGRSP